MGNYKFYTPPMLADCLMGLLPHRSYKNIIDICCGSWNLLEAAQKQFKKANYLGVDIDFEASKNCLNGAAFLCKDGRVFALEEKRKYDLVLSNPPFGYLKEEERLFKNSKKGILKGLNNKRYESEMMQANLFLVDEGGVLLFILPSTFFEGDTYLSVRKELCEKYTVDSIIKLPIETFGSSKINTYALIILNSGRHQNETHLNEIICNNGNWEVKYLGDISCNMMKEGAWIKAHKNKKVDKNLVLFRGNISSSQFCDTGTKVFHNSSIIRDGVWEPSVRYCDDEKSIENSKVVAPGDIIVNRIGRYANYWCVSKEKGIVSDCLIVIKASSEIDIYARLIKNSTNGRLNIIPKGVTTKYITMRDILDLL